MTTANATTDEVIAYLTGHGFAPHRKGSGLWVSFDYVHATGNARVAVTDAGAACFDVYAFTRDGYRLQAWRVQLTGAPLAVVAATVTAAID
ncbi:hypothetical protein [Amycolatopsis sp. cmx-11-32]|uniref:hypothetical protein n=1 Tax=Amycolatopsis sp. cmx-11-32 TaxID=2785796 RepID=UPI0039E4CD40